MPKFQIEQKSPLNLQDTYSKVKVFLETDQGLRKIDPKITCDFNEKDLSCKAQGSQFKAQLFVKEDASGSKVLIEVDLPLLLTPLKGTIKEILEKKLTKALG